MNPCLTRCIDCAFSEEIPKRLKCNHGFFNVKITDGILLVPMDSDCVLYEPKNITSEKKYEKE